MPETITPLTGYRYLIAHTPTREGIFRIQDQHGEIGDFTEEIYEACVGEAAAAGLGPVYHVHSRNNLFHTSGVHWTQLIAADDPTTVHQSGGPE